MNYISLGKTHLISWLPVSGSGHLIYLSVYWM